MEDKENKKLIDFVNKINQERSYESEEEFQHFKSKMISIIIYLKAIFDIAIDNGFSENNAIKIACTYFDNCLKLRKEDTQQK